MLGANGLSGLVAIKLHAIDLAQQIIWELDVCLIDLVNQQYDGLVRSKSLPEDPLNDVVFDVFNAFATIAELTVPKTADGVVLVEALLRFGGRFDVPLQQRHAQRLGNFLCQHGLAGPRLTFDQ